MLARSINPGRASDQAVAALALLDLPDERPVDPQVEKDLPLPQPGSQTDFANATADIVWYGGHAGPGKTWALLREPLRYHGNPLHRAVLLRRTLVQAKKPGSLWDESIGMYRAYGSRWRESPNLDHTFPSGARVVIGAIEHSKNRFDWDGTQAAAWLFDQLEGFEELMFWYVALSRSRSLSGIKPYIRATLNPVPPTDKVGGWCARLLMLGGWVDGKTGDAVPEMSGVVRYFFRDRGGDLRFYDTEREALEAHPEKASRGVRPLSFTFIEGKLEDNVILEKANPGYRDGLEALPWIERRRLLEGNWLVSSAGGGVIRRDWIPKLPYDPAMSSAGQPPQRDFYRCQTRAYDFAYTAGGGDRTASIICGREKQSGRYVFRDPHAWQESWGTTKQRVADQMLIDGPKVKIRLPQDPAAGKGLVEGLVRFLRRFAAENGRKAPRIAVVIPTRSKEHRGLDLAAEAEPPRTGADGVVSIHGNVAIVDGENVDDCLGELHHFDGSKNCAADYWDCAADAYNQCEGDSSNRRARVL